METLSGRYITAEDVGTSVEDMRAAARTTRHVSGIPRKTGYRGGDPSPLTALGVFSGLKAAVRAGLGTDVVTGLAVAVQGVGNVGYHLCKLLHDAGADLTVADINSDNTARAAREFGATVVPPGDILAAQVDVLAPCALGGVLNAETIPLLKAKVIAGAANNQLSDPEAGRQLHARGIHYAPDYVINAGGIISVTAEYGGKQSREKVHTAIERIGPRTARILQQAAQTNTAPGDIADRAARQRISDATSPQAVCA